MWRIIGPRLRRLRNQKYANIAPKMRKTATGIKTNPAMAAGGRPRCCCVGAIDPSVPVGAVGLLVDMVSSGTVNCCDWETVACCILTVGKGDDDDAAVGLCVLWPPTTPVAVCDVERPSISTTRTISPIVAARHLSTSAPPTSADTRPCGRPMYSPLYFPAFWNSSQQRERASSIVATKTRNYNRPRKATKKGAGSPRATPNR
jgi:hypothetical protein